MSSNETPSEEARSQNAKAADSSEIRIPNTAAQDEIEAIRFPPPDRPRGTIPPAVLEPGVVEVELRGDVRPQLVPPAADALPTIQSRGGGDLSGLNEILQRYQLEAAEPSIQIPEREAATAQTVARERGIDVPNLGNFVRLYFPPTLTRSRSLGSSGNCPKWSGRSLCRGQFRPSPR
jgi:hypothetical protein